MISSKSEVVNVEEQEVDTDVDEDAKSKEVVSQNGDFEVTIDNPETQLPLITHGLWTKSRKGQEVRLHEWRVLDGNFNYPLNGKCMRGPKFPWQFILFSIHFSCCLGLWYAFEIKQLFNEGYTPLSTLILGTSLLGFSLMVLNGFLVIFTEPGYIERPDWESRMENFLIYQVDKSPGVEVTKVIVVNGKPEICKFCVICCNYCPPKTEHCEMSDSCIERFDHYSKLFGNSIGVRNIGYYIMFLMIANILFVIMLTGTCIVIYKNIVDHDWKYGLSNSPTLFGLISLALYPPFAIITIPLEFFKQMFYFSLDQTKYERRNYKQANCQNKLSISTKLENLKNNIITLVWKFPSKSKIDPHKIVIAKVIPRPLRKIGEVRSGWTSNNACKTESSSESKSRMRKLRTLMKRKGSEVGPIGLEDRKQRNRHTLPSAIKIPNQNSVNNPSRSLQAHRTDSRGGILRYQTYQREHELFQNSRARDQRHRRNLSAPAGFPFHCFDLVP